MRNRLPVEKLLIVAEAIFNSKVRYGCSVYLQPIFEKEDIKAGKTTPDTYRLQVIQNNMLRMIFNYKPGDQTNMTRLRNNIKMFSVNQMVCYHVLLEAFNINNYGSSEVIQEKWKMDTRNYPIRKNRMKEVKVIMPKHTKCRGFTLYGAKILNQLPIEIREVENSERFKEMVKRYIWENIPSY